jgi:hypothetical protein
MEIQPMSLAPGSFDLIEEIVPLIDPARSFLSVPATLKRAGNAPRFEQKRAL